MEIGGAKLQFDGNETKYGIWEAKFLGYPHMLEAILGENLNRDITDTEKNEDAYTKLIPIFG